MRTKKRKSSGLVGPAIALKLLTQAMMGCALGLAFGLALVISNPAIGALIEHGGSPATLVFVVTLVTMFGIGATVTGLVLILVEDGEA